jgi:hypothetical protein
MLRLVGPARPSASMAARQGRLASAARKGFAGAARERSGPSGAAVREPALGADRTWRGMASGGKKRNSVTMGMYKSNIFVNNFFLVDLAFRFRVFFVILDPIIIKYLI